MTFLPSFLSIDAHRHRDEHSTKKGASAVRARKLEEICELKIGGVEGDAPRGSHVASLSLS